MSTRLEVYKLIEIEKSNKEISEDLNISIRTVERYRKEYIKATNDSDKKTTTTSDKKKRKEVAKAKIIVGHTIKEASEQTRTHISTIKKLSSKENLQQSQLEFLNSLRESKIKEIKSNKLKRLEANNDNLEVIRREIEAGTFNKDLQVALFKNEETEQEIFELNRLERLNKFEFEKEIYKNKLKIEVVERINSMTDDELNDLMSYINEKEKSKL